MQKENQLVYGVIPEMVPSGDVKSSAKVAKVPVDLAPKDPCVTIPCDVDRKQEGQEGTEK